MNDISNMGNDKFEIDNAPKEKEKYLVHYINYFTFSN